MPAAPAQTLPAKPAFAVILAAGLGKRMQSALPKVVHPLLGKPLIVWAVEALIDCGLRKIVIVVAKNHTIVQDSLKKFSLPAECQIEFVTQESPVGTGNAARIGAQFGARVFSSLPREDTQVLITYGDTPAVRGQTLRNLLDEHISKKNSLTLLTFFAANPFGYGRVLTDAEGHFLTIREEKDCSAEEAAITLCHSGFLCASLVCLQTVLPLLQNHNAAGEYYLTDAPFLAKNAGFSVGYKTGCGEEEFLGVNSQEQLAQMERLLQQRP